jgi:hypothetical protein
MAGNQAEKDAISNLSMSPLGYEVVDGIKAALEAACPRTVTCADVIALGGREAVFQVSGAPPLPFLSIDGLAQKTGPGSCERDECGFGGGPQRVCGHCCTEGEGRPSSRRNEPNSSQPVTSNV